MQKFKFNDNWSFTKGEGDAFMASREGGEASDTMVTLPHDAMIHEERTPDAPAGSQSGFYPGGFYTYQKYIDVPEEWQNKHVLLEFEGVYMNGRVYVNENYVGGHPYGYSNFYVCLDEFLNYGQTNRIRVTANNMNQPNSRWYSGSGIYRDVNLYLGDPIRIPENGVRITTVDLKPNLAMLEVQTQIVNEVLQRAKITTRVDIYDADGAKVTSDWKDVTVFKGKDLTVTHRIALREPRLWSDEEPNLYRAVVTLTAGDYEDVVEENFGVRMISVDPVNGFCVNGKTVNLRGTCIHHDNGVIGATTLARAEERRCQQMKDAGFNCIRSSHHPMGKAMLDACDKIGMYVMDELSDIWTLSKNPQDYTLYFTDYWKTDIKRMVEKDYNHPCVVLYSTGNEIPEAAKPHGAAMNREISDAFKALDHTRFTTSAINTLIACHEELPRIVEDLYAALNDPDSNYDPAGGVSAMNALMELFMKGNGEDMFAASPITSELIQEYVEACDINGYNYLTSRHLFDHEQNPNRVVLGTETFPAEIVRLWDVVKNNGHVIGDMTWTGYDYLGEAGCAIFYYDGTQNFSSHWPDRIAYMGDINIIGYRRPLSYLREIVFGLRTAPYISVERVNRYGQPHSQNPWMFKDCISSWTWPGYEGKPAKVDVFAMSDEVELFLNGVSLGRKPSGEGQGYITSYEFNYQPGELKAVSYINGIPGETYVLNTAEKVVSLSVDIDRSELKADGADLSFITIGLRDAMGRENLNAIADITVEVSGAGTLQGFGNADPQSIGSFDDATWPTYDGYVMAVVRAGHEAGEVTVRISGLGTEQTYTLQVK